MYRRAGDSVEVFLVHPGGPFWAKKDLGSWSIPKGEYDAGEDAVTAARREFREETGFEIEGQLVPLATVKQPGGKVISAFAVEGTGDPARVRSGLFSMEWPPKSGQRAEFPEVDRAAWFTPSEARAKLTSAQQTLVDALCALLKIEPGGDQRQ